MVLPTASHFRDHVGCAGRWEVRLVTCWGGPAEFLGTIPASARGLRSDRSPVPGALQLGAGSREQSLGGVKCPGRTCVLQLWGTPAYTTNGVSRN